LNNYYYEKKNLTIDESQTEIIGIDNIEQYSQFDNSILKITTNNKTPID
jgi:hypothetical protein